MSKSVASTRLRGLVGFVIIVSFVLLSVGVYRHAFSRPVRVSFVSPRAGLLVAPGADVRLRGVVVGRVDSVRTAGKGARLGLALDGDKSNLIPGDVTAQITPTTVVGAQYVRLIAPGTPATGAIHRGTVIRAASTVPSVNDLFQQTVSLLQAVPVHDLDVTLSALAAALDGRGARLGQTFSALDDYTRTLNQHSGALSHDISLTSSVSSEYADIANPLIDILRHSTVTGNTLVVRAKDLDNLLNSAQRLSQVGLPFVDSIRAPLTLALARLEPVTGLLAEYSPEYPCILGAMSSQALNNKSLGVKYPGAQAIMTLLPGQKGYKYPQDLPTFVDDRGPRCYSLPFAKDARLPLPYRRFNDNSHANQGDGKTKPGGSPVDFFGQTTSPGAPK